MLRNGPARSLSMAAAMTVGIALAVDSAAPPAARLDAALAARVGAGQLPLVLPPGTTLRDGPEGTAFVPGPEGPAVTVSFPEGTFPSARGMIAMRVLASRRIGFVRNGKPRVMVLVDSPAIRIELREQTDCPHLRVFAKGADKPARIIRIAYLKPDQWYHLAVSWKAASGDVDLFLNGWAQQRIHYMPWSPPATGSAEVALGGVLGEGDTRATLAVSDVRFSAWYHDESRLRASLQGVELPPSGPDIRRAYDLPVDLSPFRTEVLMEADFNSPLPVVAESELFEGQKRVREPEPGQWVLEGPGKAYTENGELVIENPAEGSAHVVLWLPRVFPDSFLLEFEITLETADDGLAIVFFAARPRDDPEESIFKPGLAMRNGVFANYIKGDINSYHVSYLAADQSGQGIFGPRRTANVRKNSGFWLIACGDDQIQGKGMGRGPHPVRILKNGNQLRIEANHRSSVAVDDDGKTWGPVWTDGYIGLRQMNHTGSARYRNLKVSRILPR